MRMSRRRRTGRCLGLRRRFWIRDFVYGCHPTPGCHPGYRMPSTPQDGIRGGRMASATYKKQLVTNNMFTKHLLFAFPSLFVRSNTPRFNDQKIDRIFSNYNSKTPGAAVAIIQNGQLVLKTDMEPLTLNMIFQSPLLQYSILPLYQNR